MGYTGGDKKNPTYYNLGDHSEALQIDYNPTKISYERLLTIFWKTHDPGIRPMSRQYWPAIFYHNEEQERLALAFKTKKLEEIKAKGEIYTKILPLTRFYLAENYHQKYMVRHHTEIIEQLEAIYPSAEEFINSTLVARINAYLGGFMAYEELQSQVRIYGLSEQRTENLLRAISKAKK